MAARPPCRPSETWAMQLACHGGASPARSRVRCPSNRPAAARLARAGRRRGRPLSAGGWKKNVAGVDRLSPVPPTNPPDRSPGAGDRDAQRSWSMPDRMARRSEEDAVVADRSMAAGEGGRKAREEEKKKGAGRERAAASTPPIPAPCKGAKSALFEGARALGFPTRPGSGYRASPVGVGGGAQGGASPPGELRRGGPSTRAAARKYKHRARRAQPRRNEGKGGRARAASPPPPRPHAPPCHAKSHAKFHLSSVGRDRARYPGRPGPAAQGGQRSPHERARARFSFGGRRGAPHPLPALPLPRTWQLGPSLALVGDEGGPGRTSGAEASGPRGWSKEKRKRSLFFFSPTNAES